MKIALAQLNPCVGDLESNLDAMLLAARMAHEQGADLLIFPNSTLTGAPIEGLMSYETFNRDVQKRMQKFAEETPVLSLLSGLSAIDQTRFRCDVELFLAGNGNVESLGIPAKQDEQCCPGFNIDGLNIAVLLGRHFAREVKLEDMDILVEMSADAFGTGYAAPAAQDGLARMSAIANANDAYVLCANLCGASDSIIFAGNSSVTAPDGSLIHACPIDKAEVFTFEVQSDKPQVYESREQHHLVSEEIMWRAITVGIRDYVRKNGFSDVLVGISGGIDSAVVATLAVDALGAKHVHGLAMPGPYSSESSLEDAKELARNLDIDLKVAPINAPLSSFHELLGPLCDGKVEGLAAENLQARIRAVELMTLCNAHNYLLLNTGNKSEAAVGFSTLYGDTAGAYAPIGGVYKSEVIVLAQWRRLKSASIPQNCIDKKPSAELYPDAKDEDRLPPYNVLDEVLYDHIEEGLGAKELILSGHEPKIVKQVLDAVKNAEYKRRQEPISAYVQGCPLIDGRDWPITNGYTEDIS